MSDEEKDKQIEAWIYLGRRYDSRDKKMYYAWEQPNGSEGHFFKTKGLVIGGIYSVLVNRKDDDSVSVYANPEPQFTNQTVDGERRAILEAMDRQAYGEQQRRAAERRFKNSSPLEDALEPLLEIVSNLRNYHEMRALTSYVNEKMSEGYYKKHDG